LGKLNFSINLILSLFSKVSRRAHQSDLEDFFRGFGRIREVVLKEGYGFVEFGSSRDALDAVRDMDGKSICGER
jgi:arginine/serine-rich splicing factor 4/5/6